MSQVIKYVTGHQVCHRSSSMSQVIKYVTGHQVCHRSSTVPQCQVYHMLSSVSQSSSVPQIMAWYRSSVSQVKSVIG